MRKLRKSGETIVSPLKKWYTFFFEYAIITETNYNIDKLCRKGCGNSDKYFVLPHFYFYYDISNR